MTQSTDQKQYMCIVFLTYHYLSEKNIGIDNTLIMRQRYTHRMSVHLLILPTGLTVMDLISYIHAISRQ